MNKRAREQHDDPLSAASAGLVALGIDRARRADALEVLALLIDRSSAMGEVVLDRDLFAREEELGIDKCLDAYSLLELLEVIVRTGRGWTIPDIAAHNGPDGETAASLAVLRKHLASVGSHDGGSELAKVELGAVTPLVITPITPRRRLRNRLPIAAGLVASAAVVAGVTQFVPQAAVSGRNAAISASAPTSVMRDALAPATDSVRGVAPPPSATAVSTDATTAPTVATDAPAACVGPKVVAAVTSIDIVRLATLDGQSTEVWAAVVKGTAVLDGSDTAVLLPALNVVAHVVGGDTDPVQATLAAPLLRPEKATAFEAIVALGSKKPTEAVTATATASDLRTC